MSRTFRNRPKNKSIRSPKTASEMRAHAGCLVDGVPVRAKRKNLPTRSDRKIISAFYEEFK